MEREIRPPEWHNFYNFLASMDLVGCSEHVAKLRDDGWKLSEVIEDNRFNGYSLNPPMEITEGKTTIEFVMERRGTSRPKLNVIGAHRINPSDPIGEGSFIRRPDLFTVDNGNLIVGKTSINSNKIRITVYSPDGTFQKSI